MQATSLSEAMCQWTGGRLWRRLLA